MKHHTTTEPADRSQKTGRRAFLRAGLTLTATAAAATGCGTASWIGPRDPRVKAAEAARRPSGRTQNVSLTAMPGSVDLGGITVATWTYGGVLPGQEIRVRPGDVINATLTNRLPTGTTVHWHGLALRNDMDGIPDVIQSMTAPGGTFNYRFTVEQPGTYWFHPHVGVQLDRGLYAPLIVEDPAEPSPYDQDWTVVLDDWIDGTGYTPDMVMTELQRGMGDMGGMDMGGMDMGPMLMGATSPLLGGDAGDVAYPYYLVNGRVADAPTTFTGKPGQRARLRFINAGGDTAFRVALGGHRMLVTHADGYPVVPVQVDTLLIGMGERYDVLVTLGDGVFPLTALAEGKKAVGRALVSTGSGTAPAATFLPTQLGGALLRYADLRPDPAVRLADRKVDTEHVLELTGSMGRYDWGLNGQRYDPSQDPLPIRQGQRVRLRFRNSTTMWHPVHLHGHTFQLAGGGPRKDTVIVLPGQEVACDFDADNPGQWMVHCHNAYHAEAGMMGIVGYER